MIKVAALTINKRERDNEPVVTVYITNYNYARYIEQSIQSVLKQSYQDFELIIIDDGSTDGSRAIIDRYVGDPQTRVIFQENKGLIASNNIAVHAARGNYVMRLDADDYLDESALLVMVNAIEQSGDYALVFPDYYYVDADGQVTGQERRHDFQKEVLLLDQPAHGACTLIRRDCLLEVGAYSGEFSCQDGWDLWLKLIENYRVRNINLPLFYYRRHGENLTNDTERLLRTRSEIYQRHTERMKRPPIRAVAVLPVRGRIIDTNSQILNLLGEKPLINWTIDSAIESKMVDELIVTTPDQELIQYLAEYYGDNITLVERSAEDALENVSFDSAVRNALQQCCKSKSYDAVLELTPESPLRSTFYIDKAINVMRVHDVDVVLGVLPEDSMFFRHTGAGLEAIGNDYNHNSLRLERDYIYKQCGGLMLVKSDYYNNQVKNSKEVKGHIILDEKASIRVRNKHEMKVAELYLEDTI